MLKITYGVAIASVGTRRGWPYQAASLYMIRTTADGRQIWQLHSHGTWRTAGAQILSRDALELCREHACKFYGKRSLQKEYIAAVFAMLDANSAEFATKLTAQPHPYNYKGETAYNYVKYMRKNAGQAGRLKAAKLVESVAGY